MILICVMPFRVMSLSVISFCVMSFNVLPFSVIPVCVMRNDYLQNPAACSIQLLIDACTIQ